MQSCGFSAACVCRSAPPSVNTDRPTRLYTSMTETTVEETDSDSDVILTVLHHCRN